MTSKRAESMVLLVDKGTIDLAQAKRLRRR